MTDRELLELAAKAANQELKYDTFGGGDNPEREYNYWNPLMDDGDALRLAVKLEMFLEIHQLVTTADIGIGEEEWITCAEKHGNDPYAATRRAIVKAAAEIGRNWLTRAIMNNEALILAEQDEKMSAILPVVPIYAAELRRLHEVNQELVEALEMCINNPWREGTMEYDVLMQVAKAALAKARGTE